MRPSPALLHLARLADAFLFWPTLTAVIWGELTGTEPHVVSLFNDKGLQRWARPPLRSAARWC
jgi:hypothetical protein